VEKKCNNSRPRLRDISTSQLPPPRLNLKEVVSDPTIQEQNILDRHVYLPQHLLQDVQRLYVAHKASLASLNSLRHEQGCLSDHIAEARLGTASISPDTRAKASKLKKAIQDLQIQTDKLNEELLELAQLLPNSSHPEAPRGPANAARLLHEWQGPNGLIAQNSCRDHLLLGNQMRLLDMESGSKVTGSSWAYLLNEAALLEQAIISYALSVAIMYGYQVAATPDVVRSDFAMRCGYQPREERTADQQTYSLSSADSDLVLSGTAEIPLAGMHANSIMDLSGGPVKHVGSGKAFRVEAGARGRESRGLYRLHQFSKVELFSVCKPGTSESLMNDMLAVQMEIIRGLSLPYR
jgi:seryl-tRNA synthetase